MLFFTGSRTGKHHSRPEDVIQDVRVVPNKWYIIDYQTSQQLKLGPGAQPAIPLPENTQVRKPDGITSLDPYAWDVYCLGWIYLALCSV